MFKDIRCQDNGDLDTCTLIPLLPDGWMDPELDGHKENGALLPGAGFSSPVETVPVNKESFPGITKSDWEGGRAGKEERCPYPPAGT